MDTMIETVERVDPRLQDPRIVQQMELINDIVLVQQSISNDELLAMADFDVKLNAAFPINDDVINDVLRAELRSFWRALCVEIDCYKSSLQNWRYLDAYTFRSINKGRRNDAIAFLESLTFGPENVIILHWYEHRDGFRLELKTNPAAR